MSYVKVQNRVLKPDSPGNQSVPANGYVRRRNRIYFNAPREKKVRVAEFTAAEPRICTEVGKATYYFDAGFVMGPCLTKPADIQAWRNAVTT